MDASLRPGVIRARAEVAALLMKAARGAGLPLALAEDLYQMADFISADDAMHVAADIAAGGPALLELTHALDEMACGETQKIEAPLAGALAATRGWVLIGGERREGRPEKLAGPIELSDEVLSRLEALAARTYVPESDASRARGAGAGAIDND